MRPPYKGNALCIGWVCFPPLTLGKGGPSGKPIAIAYLWLNFSANNPKENGLVPF